MRCSLGWGHKVLVYKRSCLSGEVCSVLPRSPCQNSLAAHSPGLCVVILHEHSSTVDVNEVHDGVNLVMSNDALDEEGGDLHILGKKLHAVARK